MTLVLEVLVKSTTVLAATALLSLVVRRRVSASIRHTIWMTGLIAACVVPVVGQVAPAWHLPLLPVLGPPQALAQPVTLANPVERADAGTGMHSIALDSSRQATGSPARVPGPTTPAVAVMAPDAASPTWARLANVPSPSGLLLGGWLVGTCVLLGRLVIAAWAARRVSASHVPGPAPWLVEARHLARALGVSRHVRFVRSPRVTMPMACGVLRPAVVLPVDVDDWPESRATAALLHELAHVRRRDCLTQAVADAVFALYWFNPLAALAVRAVRRERERACDDMVLAAGTPAPEYAAHLLDVARAARRPLPFRVAPGVAMARRSELEGRLMAILDDTLPRRGVSVRAALGTTVLAVVVAVPLATLDPWTTPPAAAATLVPQPMPAGPASQRPAAPPVAVQATVVEADAERALETAHELAMDAEHEPIADALLQPVVAPQPMPMLQPVPMPMPMVMPMPLPATGAAVAARASVEALIAAQAGPDGARPRADVRPADPAIVSALVGALADEDAGVRMQAAHALSHQRDPAAQKALAGLLTDPDEDLRRLAVMSLAQMRDPASYEPLVAALRDEDPQIRQQALFGLSQLRDPRAAGPLTAALGDTDAAVRQQAAFALGQLRTPAAVDALMAAAKDAEPDVRAQALFALAQIGDLRARDLAIASLKDADADVRRMAAFALMRLAGN